MFLLCFLIAIYSGIATSQGTFRITGEPGEDSSVSAISTAERVGVTGEPIYPTPFVLGNLLFPGLVSEDHDNIFEVAVAMQPIAYSSFFSLATGEQEVSDLRQKIRSLITNPRYTRPEVYKDAVILSLGEGYSGLVPYLRSIGIEAYGLDLIYDKDLPEDFVGREFISEYINRHRDYLIAGDATDLSKVKKLTDNNGLVDFQNKIYDRSVDLVVSHYLLEYLKPEYQKKMLSESLRVLNYGGEAKFVMKKSHIAPDDNYKGGLSSFIMMLETLRQERRDFVINYVAVFTSVVHHIEKHPAAVSNNNITKVIPGYSDAFGDKYRTLLSRDLNKKNPVFLTSGGVTLGSDNILVSLKKMSKKESRSLNNTKVDNKLNCDDTCDEGCIEEEIIYNIDIGEACHDQKLQHNIPVCVRDTDRSSFCEEPCGYYDCYDYEGALTKYDCSLRVISQKTCAVIYDEKFTGNLAEPELVEKYCDVEK
jgi:hypothetical protein